MLEVVDAILVDDAEIEPNHDGWYLSEDALNAVHNQARSAGRGLVEFHNHRAGPPGFSAIDERALAEMSGYAVDLLDGAPYGAAVWAQEAIRADWWRPGPDAALERAPFRTVTVVGEHLKVLNAQPATDERFTRQIPLLGPGAQAAIGTLRVGLVGAGGTGSHICLALAYLGFRDFVVLDDNLVDTTNLNRLVTADQADLHSPKTIVARRRMRAIDPRIKVRTLPGLTPGGAHPELNDVDLIIGCVDHDGPRHRLNQIAIDTRTPLLDIATGVDERGTPLALGGRVTLMLPGEACLTCQSELDSAEISRWAKPEHERALDRAHGYGTGTANPSVVYLNGLAVNAALAEIGAWISGARPRPAGSTSTWSDFAGPPQARRSALAGFPRATPDASTAPTRREQRRFREPQLSFRCQQGWTLPQQSSCPAPTGPGLFAQRAFRSMRARLSVGSE